MQIRHASSPTETASMNTAALRQQYLLEQLFEQGQIHLTYTHHDRMVIGGILPQTEALALPVPPELKADFFLDRRELGVINIGGPGKIVVDEAEFVLEKLDCLYAGKGVRQLLFSSLSADNPARFFLLSAPAHRKYPTQLMTADQANPNQLGATETANKRTIYKYIHADGLESCQLVMGLTILNTGSVWNTMPPHTHDRRSEVYCYFDIPDNQRVLHLMGEPSETRHLWVSNHQAIISPSWSIHSGCGTMAYSFIWGMAGENQSFADMDQVAVSHLA